MTASGFYTREADLFVPTGIGVSPWNARAQMGVSLAGLVAHILEAVPRPAPMFTARLTIDILGAVPIEPMSSVVRVVREGRRIQMLDAELRIRGRTWVRASALRMRIGQSPESSPPLTQPAPGVTDGSSNFGWAETMRLHGGHDLPGPGALWVRMAMDVVKGEPLTPLEAVAMVADFGSGTAPLVPFQEWTFANVDVAIHLTRPPREGWILIDATSESAGNGVGLTHSRLGDRDGMIGIAHQTTFLERR